MPGSHGTLCINSFYPETELNITKIQGKRINFSHS